MGSLSRKWIKYLVAVLLALILAVVGSRVIYPFFRPSIASTLGCFNRHEEELTCSVDSDCVLLGDWVGSTKMSRLGGQSDHCLTRSARNMDAIEKQLRLNDLCYSWAGVQRFNMHTGPVWTACKCERGQCITSDPQ